MEIQYTILFLYTLRTQKEGQIAGLGKGRIQTIGINPNIQNAQNIISHKKLSIIDMSDSNDDTLLVAEKNARNDYKDCGGNDSAAKGNEMQEKTLMHLTLKQAYLLNLIYRILFQRKIRMLSLSITYLQPRLKPLSCSLFLRAGLIQISRISTA